jgi:hypothetical protein
MAIIKAVENVTLDGVMESPESWAGPYQDEVLGQAMAQDMARPGGLLFGRRTYEEFIRAWGGRSDNPFTPVLEALALVDELDLGDHHRLHVVRADLLRRLDRREEAAAALRRALAGAGNDVERAYLERRLSEL